MDYMNRCKLLFILWEFGHCGLSFAGIGASEATNCYPMLQPLSLNGYCLQNDAKLAWLCEIKASGIDGGDSAACC